MPHAPCPMPHAPCPMPHAPIDPPAPTLYRISHMTLALVDLCGEDDVLDREGDVYWKRPLEILNEAGISFIDFASGAKTIPQKVERFHEALKSDADFIWVVRGGYVCVETLDLIDWDLVAEKKKPLYGISDFTHLSWLAVPKGVPCYYGQSFTKFEEKFPTAEDRAFLLSFLKTGIPPSLIAQPLSPRARETDLSQSPMIGGHLVIVLLMLLQYPVDLKDRYLFLEYHPGCAGEGMYDIGYYLEHLVRILTRTKNLPKGIVFGQSLLPQMDGTMIPWKEINQYCAARVSSLEIPVYEVDHFRNVIPFSF